MNILFVDAYIILYTVFSLIVPLSLNIPPALLLKFIPASIIVLQCGSDIGRKEF